MKKLVCLMAGMLASALAFAGENDYETISFYSEGPDSYMDGSYVLDGEFYALVWVPNNADVPEFFADGAVRSNGCKILSAGRWASNKGCGEMYTIPVVGITVRSPMTLSVTNKLEKLISGGSFRLCLLDTRKADGKLALSTTTITNEFGVYVYPTTVNGYKTTAQLTGEAAAIATSVGIESSIRIETASKVPDGVKPPVIVGMTFRGEGDARVMDIEVEYTYEYLQYTVAGGATVGTIGKTAATGATAADGDQTKRIVITVPAKGDSNFYRVIRK